MALHVQHPSFRQHLHRTTRHELADSEGVSPLRDGRQPLARAQFAALMDNDATEEDLVEMTKQREEQSKRENSEAAEERKRRESEEAERIRREQEQFWNDPLDAFDKPDDEQK